MRQNHQPNQQVSKLVFLVGFARWGAAILYPKIAREPHQKLLWFFFLGTETHWVSQMGGSRKKNEKHTWTPMSNEHPRIHMNSSEFHKRFSWHVRFWTIVFTFFDYFVLLFLHLLVSFFPCCLFLILCWLGAPKNYPLPLLQNMFFSCLGMSENEVAFFPFKVTILGSKKDTSFWDIQICPYIVLDMCFCCFHAVLACLI